MLNKEDVIDLLPRFAWIVHLGLIFYFHFKITESVELQSETIPVIIGLSALFFGIYLWISSSLIVFKYRKRFSPTKVFTEGPYRYIRHPMYVGIYLTIIGISILLKLRSAIIISALFIPVWIVLSKLEEKEMIKRFNGQYIDYKKQTGMFFPKIKKSKYQANKNI